MTKSRQGWHVQMSCLGQVISELLSVTAPAETEDRGSAGGVTVGWRFPTSHGMLPPGRHPFSMGFFLSKPSIFGYLHWWKASFDREKRSGFHETCIVLITARWTPWLIKRPLAGNRPMVKLEWESNLARGGHFVVVYHVWTMKDLFGFCTPSCGRVWGRWW